MISFDGVERLRVMNLIVFAVLFPDTNKNSEGIREIDQIINSYA